MTDLKLLKTITPEVIGIFETRYSILRTILYNQPIGRRSLSNLIDIQERTVRNEANILRKQGLLEIEKVGMSVTNDGLNLLNKLSDTYIQLKGIPELEVKLKAVLGIRDVYIVPGNSEKDKLVLKDLAKKASLILKSKVVDNDIIGITGGTTMAEVAKNCTQENRNNNLTVIPARGGLGRNLHTQSNSIAVQIAEKLNGEYKLLYVPDGLSENALKHMVQNQEIKESLELINNMNILVFGIGRADVMAKRRNLGDKKIDKLIELGAVAEAFGHYFNIYGKDIWEYKTIGLSLEQFKSLSNVIGVAGGESKAEAIMAISTLNSNLQLITDESAARKILNISKLD